MGPLLNPAIAFGEMIWTLNFSYIIQYFLMPFVGSVLALVFYEYVFVKSQEYLNGDDSEEGSDDGGLSIDSEQLGGAIAPAKDIKETKESKEVTKDDEPLATDD